MMKRAVSPDRERRGRSSNARSSRVEASVVDLTGDSERDGAQTAYPPRAELSSLMKGVQEHDVIFSGPGGGLDTLNRHVGNVRFEKLCLSYQNEYTEASSVKEKRAVAQHVIFSVQRGEPPGRFLRVSRTDDARNVWARKETLGHELEDKVLEALHIILGGSIDQNDKKRKRESLAPSSTATVESTSRPQGAVTPQCASTLPDPVPSRSALAQLASVAEAAASRPAMRAPPQVPVLSTKPLPTISFDPNLLPVRYSNVNLSSLSDEFRHQVGLRDYVFDYYSGDYTRMATEHARLTACPHPDTWEVRLVEAAGRAFDICQKYMNPNVELSGNQQLHTRTVIDDSDLDYRHQDRASKRARMEGGQVDQHFNSTQDTEPATETLCAGTVTDCKRTASRYILYIARQLYRSKNQSGIAKWFAAEVLKVLEHGKPEAQEVAVLLLALAAMEVNQDEKKFGGANAWSFAGMFVVGSAVKLVPVQHRQWRTRQRTPSYIRRITGRLLHFHEIIFAGATVNCTRSREFARWQPILQEPGRLARSFVMQDLSTKFRVARHFEKASSAPPRAPPALPVGAAAGPPPLAGGVPITPDRDMTRSPWVQGRGYM